MDAGGGGARFFVWGRGRSHSILSMDVEGQVLGDLGDSYSQVPFIMDLSLEFFKPSRIRLFCDPDHR